MNKRDENSKRVRYIRELNMFMNKMASVVSKENLDKEALENAIERSKKRLEKVYKVEVYSTHINAIEDSIKNITSYKDLEFDELKSKIQKECNLYEKSRKSKNYKKPKHKIVDYDE